MDTDHLFTEMCDNGSTDAARIEDLGPNDFAKVGSAACVHTAIRRRISLTTPAVSPTARRLVALQRRERFAGRLRPDFGKYPLQELNARRERIMIGVYGVGQ
jgi:hypothetical protein